MTHAAKQLLRLGVSPQIVVRLEEIAAEEGRTLREAVQSILTKYANEKPRRVATWPNPQVPSQKHS